MNKNYALTTKNTCVVLDDLIFDRRNKMVELPARLRAELFLLLWGYYYQL